MKIHYEIRFLGYDPCVYLFSDPPQYLSPHDLLEWAIEVKDRDQELYQQIAAAYRDLTSPPPHCYTKD